MADLATFRTVFPEFTATKATDGQINYWLGVGATSLSSTRIAPNTDLAIMLFAAHNLVLSLNDQDAVRDGYQPGDTVAPLSSEGAGGLSAGFDNNLTGTEDAGIYNGTSYGQRLWAILKAASKGGFFGRRPVNYLPSGAPFLLRNS